MLELAGLVDWTVGSTPVEHLTIWTDVKDSSLLP
jgi:hypothetical protein